MDEDDEENEDDGDNLSFSGSYSSEEDGEDQKTDGIISLFTLNLMCVVKFIMGLLKSILCNGI